MRKRVNEAEILFHGICIALHGKSVSPGNPVHPHAHNAFMSLLRPGERHHLGHVEVELHEEAS